MKRYFLIALLLALATLSSTTVSASLRESSPLGEGDSPRSRSVEAILSAPEADDSHFVADTGGDLDQYLFRTDVPDGRLRFNIPITRYYFNSNDIDSDDFDSNGFLTDAAVDRAVSNGTLPETAVLTLRVFDVDEEAEWCPEVDLLYVNENPIYVDGQQVNLSGANETWSTPSFRIPIEVLKFPKSRGESAAPTPVDNEISIRIDSKDCTYEGIPAWAVQVDWGEIEIPSPIRPIVFVHGWTGTTESFSYIEDRLAADGIPSAGHADLLEGLYPIPLTATWLESYMHDAMQEFGVDKVNLFAHSKGGLVSRQALRLDTTAEGVEHLVTFASPHHGTRWAEWETAMELICEHLKYPDDPAKAELCFTATQEFRRDTIQEEFNYYGCSYEWWPLPPHWEGCEPRYVQQDNVEYFSLAGESDVAVRPLASTTYPWLADDIPFPDSIDVDGVFDADHGGMVESGPAYECAMHLLDGKLYQCPAPDTRSSTASEAEPQQVILSESGSLAAFDSHSTFAAVDGGSQLVFEAYGDHACAFSLVEPGGRVIDPGVASSDTYITYEAHDDGSLWQYRYHLTYPVTGDWEVVLQVDSDFNFALWGLTNSDSELLVKTDRFTYRPGDSVTVEAALTDGDLPITGVAFTGLVTHPDDATEPLVLIDDGTGSDAMPGDGIYTGEFTASTTTGYATIQVEASKGSVERTQTAVVAFGSQTATLQGILSETPVDTNANGLYDWLYITAEMEVLQAGHFDVQATLRDAGGEMITTAYFSTRQSGEDPWPVGTHPVVLSFDGSEIAQHGVDGPYALSMLFIYDTTSYRLEVYQGEDLYTTAAYLVSQFERPLIVLAGGDETVLDLDGNGRYDLLTISLLVDIALPGDYEANGRLTDPEGGEIAWATDSFSAPGSGTYQIDLLFDGNAIGTHQVDGPYSLHDLTVFNTTGIGSDTFYSSYTTEAYPFTAFEGGFYGIFLPVVLRGYGAGPSPESLYGHVTDNGLPVAGTELLLRYYNGLTWLTYANTYTDSNGNYEFTNPPDLSSEQYMYVRWYNEGDPSRLSTWGCSYVFSTSGPEANECSFDLDNIDLVSPGHGSSVWLPATFTWNMRGIATDSYEVDLADMSDYDPYWWTEVGHVNSYVLNSLPSGFDPYLPYGWWMWVYGPDGYGVSYYYHSITFMNSGRSVDVQAIPSSHFLPEDRIEMAVPWNRP